MLYRGEVVIDGSAIHSQNYTKATHPNHVARHLMSYVSNDKPYFTVFVANTDGDIWEYSFERTAKIPRGWSKKLDKRLNKHDVMRVFSGAITIFSTLKER